MREGGLGRLRNTFDSALLLNALTTISRASRCPLAYQADVASASSNTPTSLPDSIAKVAPRAMTMCESVSYWTFLTLKMR